jgi:hypothetical protein
MHEEEAVERIARLGLAEQLTDITAKRLESLSLANLRVSDEIFTTLALALRLSRKTTIILPMHRFEGLSRGRGWARKGSHANAEWGEREDGGYRVGPGRWIVGGNDGFQRKGQTVWTVKHIQVGDETWTIAD